MYVSVTRPKQVVLWVTGVTAVTGVTPPPAGPVYHVHWLAGCRCSCCIWDIWYVADVESAAAAGQPVRQPVTVCHTRLAAKFECRSIVHLPRFFVLVWRLTALAASRLLVCRLPVYSHRSSEEISQGMLPLLSTHSVHYRPICMWLSTLHRTGWDCRVLQLSS